MKPTTPTTSTIHAILVTGFWLGGWAWDGVTPTLQTAGITTHNVTLPGLASINDNRTNITFNDHVTAITTIIQTVEHPVVLIGHSGGGVIIQAAADRMANRIRRMIYIDNGPLLPGIALHEPNPSVDLPFPTWDEFEATDVSPAGLNDNLRQIIRDRAVPHPMAVATTPINVSNDQRLALPTTVICTSLPSTMLRQLVEAGHIPTELPTMTDVTYIDLETGHWPMLSRPNELANILTTEILR